VSDAVAITALFAYAILIRKFSSAAGTEFTGNLGFSVISESYFAAAFWTSGYKRIPCAPADDAPEPAGFAPHAFLYRAFWGLFYRLDGFLRKQVSAVVQKIIGQSRNGG